MDISFLYMKIQSQWDLELPFVIYRKSGEKELHSFLQNNNELYKIDSYDTTGFVFAPFDNRDDTILISAENSEYYRSVISETEFEVQHNKQSISIDIDDNEKEAHLKLVSKGIEAITQNSFKKVVLSRKEEIHFSDMAPLEVFTKLVDSYPNAFVYCWYHPAFGIWLGATPETLVTIKGDQFFTMSLAGTQPYVDSLEVKWGAKEIEEQAMVTDYVINKLSSKVDSLEKSGTYTHKAGTLLHLRTDIKGTLIPNNSNIEDIIKTLHPTPAVCGLPKEEAKSFIIKNELYDRKFYTGFLGELNISKNGEKESNLFVNLRCMELFDDKAVIYVGGGITKDSVPEKEWEETVRKTETMKMVLS
ncbi:isochorismate synthase [Aquimarina sp. SS2-1]|uniref:isochorismate synthase n=1 Tax=Aquimarina besae TaxID=3342247 RepID=UPI00366F19F8